LGSQIALRGIPQEEYRACITEVLQESFHGTPTPEKFPKYFSDFFSETKSVITARLSSNE